MFTIDIRIDSLTNVDKMRSLLASSNCILFFSLPFKPVGAVSPFFNGHIAVSLEGTLYHIVNPNLLRSDFLFSIMPAESWLFGQGGAWVERDASSPQYKHVYLYRKNETARTVVYGAGITVERTKVTRIRQMFTDEEERFCSGLRKYSFLQNNCSSIIARPFTQEGLVPAGVQNTIPALFLAGLLPFSATVLVFVLLMHTTVSGLHYGASAWGYGAVILVLPWIKW